MKNQCDKTSVRSVMVDVFVRYVKFEQIISDKVYSSCLRQLPPFLQIVNSKYVRWQDRQAHLLGKFLLMMILKELKLNFGLNDLRTTKYGKPYINDTFDFSISHSGTYVVLAMARDTRLGLDIEEIATIDIHDFKNAFTSTEFDLILKANDSLNTFYKYWTWKESVVKADGRGLTIPTKEIAVNQNEAVIAGQRWYLTELKIDKRYQTCLAIDTDMINLRLEETDIMSVLGHSAYNS